MCEGCGPVQAIATGDTSVVERSRDGVAVIMTDAACTSGRTLR